MPHVGENATRMRNKVTLREFFNHRLSVRDEDIYSPILDSESLLQQYSVDGWCRIEANNLFYIRQNQDNLRAEEYKSLISYLEARNGDNNRISAGTPVILPSTFEGSIRAQLNNYQDSMAVAGHYHPDGYRVYLPEPDREAACLPAGRCC